MKSLLLVLIAVGVAGALHGQSGTLAVQNTSSVAVNETYISPSSVSTWGPNLGTIAGNSTSFHNVPGDDFYDLRVVFANTDEMEVFNIWIASGATETEKVCIFADNCDDGGSGGGGGGGDDESCSASGAASLWAMFSALTAIVVLGVRGNTRRACL